MALPILHTTSLSEAFCLTMLHSLWQGVLIGAITLVILRLLRADSPRWRYLLSLAALVLIITAPAATFVWLQPVPTMPAPAPVPITSRNVRPTAAPEFIPPPVLVEDSIPRNTQEVGDHFNSVMDPLPATEPLPPQFTLAPVESEPVNWFARISFWVTAIWMAGVSLLTLRLVAGYCTVWSWSCGGILPRDELVDRFEQLTMLMKLRCPPRLILSKKVTDAIVFGYLKPVILVPILWATEFPPEVLDSILLHELAHIRRFDVYVILLQRIGETLYFYHPVVWWLSRRMSYERELCCDELAVRVTGSNVTYATALEYVAHVISASTPPRRQPALSPSLGGQKMELLHRIQHVLSLKTPAAKRRPLLDRRSLPLTLLALVGLAISQVPAGPMQGDQIPVDRQQPDTRSPVDNPVTPPQTDQHVKPGDTEPVELYDLPGTAGPIPPDAVLAIVDGEVIRLEDLDQIRSIVNSQLTPDRKQTLIFRELAPILEKEIEETLLFHEAQKQLVTEIVDQTRKEFEQSHNEIVEKCLQGLRHQKVLQAGSDVENAERLRLRNTLWRSRLAREVLQNHVRGVNVTPSLLELQAEYERRLPEFTTRTTLSWKESLLFDPLGKMPTDDALGRTYENIEPTSLKDSPIKEKLLHLLNEPVDPAGKRYSVETQAGTVLLEILERKGSETTSFESVAPMLTQHLLTAKDNALVKSYLDELKTQAKILSVLPELKKLKSMEQATRVPTRTIQVSPPRSLFEPSFARAEWQNVGSGRNFAYEIVPESRPILREYVEAPVMADRRPFLRSLMNPPVTMSMKRVGVQSNAGVIGQLTFDESLSPPEFLRSTQTPAITLAAAQEQSAPPEEKKEVLVTVVYQVADLLVPKSVEKANANGEQRRMVSERSKEALKRLITELIGKDQVQPQGEGNIVVYEQALSVVVRTTQENHKKIQRVLGPVRELLDPENVEAEIKVNIEAGEAPKPPKISPYQSDDQPDADLFRVDRGTMLMRLKPFRSRTVEIPGMITRITDFDAEMIGVKALSPSRIQVYGKAVGVTSMHVTNARGTQFQINIQVTRNALEVVTPSPETGQLKLMEKLQQPVSFQFVDTPLTKVMQNVAHTQGLNVVVDRSGLEMEGHTVQTPISLAVSGISLGSALHLILEPLGLFVDLDVNHNCLVVTSRRAPSRYLGREYQLAELVSSDGNSAESVQRIGELIVSTICPNEWDKVGGRGTVSARAGDTLFIRQTPEVHQQIVDLLNRLTQQRNLATISQIPEVSAEVPESGVAAKIPAVLKSSQTCRWSGSVIDVWPAVASTLRINICVDREGLKEAGVPETQLIEIISRPAESVGESLHRSLDSLSLTTLIDHEVLLITTKSKGQGMCSTLAYPVPVGMSVDELSKRLVQEISPDEWDVSGGQGVVVADRHSLVVYQSAAVHRAIRDWVMRLKNSPAD